MSKLVGKTVKILPGTIFYIDGGDNTGVILREVEAVNGNKGVMVAEHSGVMLWCYLDELCYMNNKKVAA